MQPRKVKADKTTRRYLMQQSIRLCLCRALCVSTWPLPLGNSEGCALLQQAPTHASFEFPHLTNHGSPPNNSGHGADASQAAAADAPDAGRPPPSEHSHAHIAASTRTGHCSGVCGRNVQVSRTPRELHNGAGTGRRSITAVAEHQCSLRHHI